MPTILVVDDHEEIREALADLLHLARMLYCSILLC